MFEQEAAAWIQWARDPRDAYWYYRDAFFELLPEPPQRTLEVGCGEGRVMRDLKPRGFEVTGVEVAPTLLEAARAEDPDGDYVLADAKSLPFGSGSFELVVAYNSLMGEDMPTVIAEVARVLVPEGRLCACITHPIADSGHWTGPETFAIGERYLEGRPFEGTFERSGLPPITFSGWVHPLEAYSRALEESGFVLEALREPPATESEVEANPNASRWQRLPNFLMFRARLDRPVTAPSA
jgi:SAM-dependent methyltransferase